MSFRPALPSASLGPAGPSRDRAPASMTPQAVLLAVVAVMAWQMALVASPVWAEPTSGRWQWPTDPPHPVLHPFEQPAHRYAAGHRGLDIAVAGTDVRAVEGGTVRFAGDVAGRGVVSVLHADGLLSTYEPVDAVVEAGARVEAGDLLGHVTTTAAGAWHCPKGPCLHLGARRGEDYLDPLLLLGARGPSVLLPLGGGGSPAPGGPAGGVSPGASDAPGEAGRKERAAGQARDRGSSSPSDDARAARPGGPGLREGRPFLAP